MNTKSQNSMATCPAPAQVSNFAANAGTPKWQYNGVAPFGEIVQWCRDTFGFVDWFWRNETIYFENEQDYTMFLLRWS